jgi:hypothetical protein
MALPNHLIAEAIDTAPLNRGLVGADWLARKENVPVTFDNGDIALFDYEGDDVYQVHFLFQSRGRKAIDHARESFKTMFMEHGAALIMGLTPVAMRHARIFNRWIGGHSAGTRWAPEGPGLPDVEFELFVLSKFQWKVANQ